MDVQYGINNLKLKLFLCFLFFTENITKCFFFNLIYFKIQKDTIRITILFGMNMTSKLHLLNCAWKISIARYLI